MDREITLRDYGRVLWSGRWLILASTVVAALVGLLLTFVTSTEYTGHRARLPRPGHLGLGHPVLDPGHQPGHRAGPR